MLGKCIVHEIADYVSVCMLFGGLKQNGYCVFGQLPWPSKLTQWSSSTSQNTTLLPRRISLDFNQQAEEKKTAEITTTPNMQKREKVHESMGKNKSMTT